MSTSDPARVMVVSGNPSARDALVRLMGRAHRVSHFDTAEAASQALESFRPDTLMIDLQHTKEAGALLVKRVRVELPECVVLMLCEQNANEQLRLPGSTLAEIEKVAILKTLAAVNGSTTKAAEILDISPRKIQYRLREWRETGGDNK